MKLSVSLPQRPTSLFGRDSEIASVRQLLLSEVRLVTLTGPPGVGKTRLALEVAAGLADWYRDGVAFVDLSPIRDPQLVSKAIASVLGLWEVSSRPIDKQLRDQLKDKEFLLLLDNFEQVAEAAPQIAGLLTACPHLKILVTSRMPLHIGWEREWLVSPLPVPAAGERVGATALQEYPAVALFASRAHAVRADFALTDHNAAVVAEICARLDGLPLAIELAAPRIKMLTPHAVLELLKRRLSLFGGLARDLPPRHQTLRAAVGWSYALLGPSEQSLFRRLAVFAGGCTVESAEKVAGDAWMDVLEGLAQLVDKSLLQREALPDGSVRFRMLETIREFALEQLSLSGELDRSWERHAGYFLELSERAEVPLTRSGDLGWLNLLDAEHDNFRTALEWMVAHPGQDLALRMAQSLWPYWSGRGYYSEGLEWLQRALSLCPQAAPLIQIKGLLAAGAMASSQDDYDHAVGFFERGLGLARAHGEVPWVAFALAALGHDAWHQGDSARADRLCSESLTSARAVGEPWLMAFAVSQSAAVAWHEEDYDRAGTFAEEALKLSAEVVPLMASPSPSAILAIVAQHRNDIRRAEALFRDSLTSARRLRDRFNMAISLVRLGDISRVQRNLGQAWALYCEALPLLHEIDDRWFRAACLRGMAGIAFVRRQPAVAARLLGAAAAAEDGIGMPAQSPHPVDAATRDALGDEHYFINWTEGRALSLDQAVRYALDVGTVLMNGQAKRRGRALSAREREVAALLARGLSNQQIGEALFITEKTAAHHVQHILDKLAFRSRAQVAAWAVRQGLVKEDPDR